MSDTQLHEERIVLRIDGIQKFQAQVICTDRGVLPDVGLFLFQIVDQADPLQDVFVRIVEIADFASSDGYLDDRYAATMRGDTYWRGNVLTKLYDDINVANAAVQAIFDRVNTLVNDYTTYATEFETGGEDISFPTADPTEVQTLKANYDSAYAAYQAAQTAQTAAEASRTSAQANLAAAQTELQNWQNLKDLFTTAQSVKRRLTMQISGYVNCVPSDIGKTVTQLTSGHTGTLLAFDNSPFSPIWLVNPASPADTFEDPYVVTIGGTPPGTGQGTPLGSSIVSEGLTDIDVSALSQINDQLNKHGAVVTSTRDDITSAQAALNSAQGDTLTAYTALQTAYNDVKGVCPNWTPQYPFPPIPA